MLMSMQALASANVPVSRDNIKEMIQLMDNGGGDDDNDENGDGEISWREFEVFFMYEFAAGKNLLSGECCG